MTTKELSDAGITLNNCPSGQLPAPTPGSVEFYRAVLRKIADSWLDCDSAGVLFRQRMAQEALEGKWPDGL